tara:strand:- start:22659 stop:22856 length:198 start_codon:yes stop_codon:yes gene_type:complete
MMVTSGTIVTRAVLYPENFGFERMQQQPAMVLAFCTFVFIIFNIGYVELVQSEIDDMIPNATAII